MSKSLFDQLSDVERTVVSQLVGGDCDASFRNYLRATPAIPEPFVLGEAARAYLNARITALSVPVEGDTPRSTGMKNEVIDVDGTNWLVREAVSREEAEHAITMARVTGSVGSKHREQRNGVDTVTADVVRLNADGTECLPYGEKGTDQSALLSRAYQESGLRGRIMAGALDEVEALATGEFPIHHDAAFLRKELVRIVTESRAAIAKARAEAQKGN